MRLSPITAFEIRQAQVFGIDPQVVIEFNELVLKAFRQNKVSFTVPDSIRNQSDWCGANTDWIQQLGYKVEYIEDDVYKVSW